jgi:hypothetical protein
LHYFLDLSIFKSQAQKPMFHASAIAHYLLLYERRTRFPPMLCYVVFESRTPVSHASDSLPFVIIRVLSYPYPSSTPKEINIGKLLHLIHIHGLDYLLVVEKDPRLRALPLNLFSNECNIVTIKLAIVHAIKERLHTLHGYWRLCGIQSTGVGIGQGDPHYRPVPLAGIQLRSQPLQNRLGHQGG